ncbi:hypothetical protein JHN55_09655 [Streptomyces sp. MBT56]|uniref:SAV_6107 family HEPN domain-containing protein n=1 Tax=unclassified Streptomyces TaxID=2593676 RepID=UPI00190CD2FD|nr:hypothetical protein [Streptomyces sp. MBT72]MBK3540085.1 hypothetical protein [Streptomyces sp. MBT67]MBK3554409.1 hypothetical protein [Streptomyces sp. MBT61]MBK3556786.1 hypothetical protein [Streptomyces sp. MBT56]MBK3604555.1 hypothetical protein [Streptomyces sp. MBT54]MBK3616936.1 hypothetical protein [Streptomyces sp. MBT98]
MSNDHDDGLTGHRARTRSSWDLLPEVAPEFAEYFDKTTVKMIRAEAGIVGAVNIHELADTPGITTEFVRKVGYSRTSGALPHRPATETAPQPCAEPVERDRRTLHGTGGPRRIVRSRQPTPRDLHHNGKLVKEHDGSSRRDTAPRRSLPVKRHDLRGTR